MKKIDQIKKHRELDFNLQNDRLRSLGELSASILHEINQPITGIRLSSELTIRLLNSNQNKNPENIQKNLQEILNLSKKVEEIINRLQSFSRIGNQDDFTEINLNKSINNAVNLFKHQFLNENIKIITNLNDIPLIRGHEIWLDQIFVNLLSNAKDALVNQKFNEKIISEKIVSITTQLNNIEKKVQILVTDNAGSINNNIKNKIFEPFFTTKKVIGNGLGLTIIKLIIKSLKGSIKLEVNEGIHSTFKIFLPVI